MTRPKLPFPQDVDAPAFEEAWHAQAFVLVCQLHEQGCFTWPEWAATLSQVIETADKQDPANTGAAYYHHWLAALEQIIFANDIAKPADVDRWEKAWRQAFATTPHGAPVEL